MSFFCVRKYLKVNIMKRFDNHFKTKLWNTIAEIENNSLVEVVVIIKPRSASYSDIPVWVGTALMVIFFSLVMFLPIPFYDFELYAVPLTAFVLGVIITWNVPSFERIFIPAKRMNRNVEIMARAIFQKAGIQHTANKTGILFYGSVLEKTIFILPDKGAEHAIPLEEWTALKLRFDQVFAQPNPQDALIKELHNVRSIFNQYIPPVENDINELPDDLDVEF